MRDLYAWEVGEKQCVTTSTGLNYRTRLTTDVSNNGIRTYKKGMYVDFPCSLVLACGYQVAEHSVLSGTTFKTFWDRLM